MKAVAATIPAAHPATLSLLVRDLFWDVIRHGFLSFFSLHPSLPVCFLGSREVSGEEKLKESRIMSEDSVCASDVDIRLTLQVGLFG